MSREEYYNRITAAELRISRERYQKAQIALDNRAINNAILEPQNKEDVSTFAIRVPEQVIDLAHVEGVYLQDPSARATDVDKLLGDLEAIAAKYAKEEKQVKESNLERFRNIARDMYK